MKEQYDPSIARIKPPKQVSEPFYIKLEDLEAFRELPTKSRIRRVVRRLADHA